MNCDTLYSDRPTQSPSKSISDHFDPVEAINKHEVLKEIVPATLGVKDTASPLLHERHSIIYSPQSLRILCQRTGFSIIEMKEVDDYLSIYAKKR